MRLLYNNKTGAFGEGKRRRVPAALVCLALLFTLCLSLPLPASFAASDSLKYASAQSGSYSESVSPSSLVGLFGGETPSDAEKAYIDLFPDFVLTYSPRVPVDQVEVSGFEDTVTVRARVWSYTAQNGKTVTFCPDSTELDGVSAGLTGSGNTREVIFTGVDNSHEHDIRVFYHADIDIPANILNTLINLAYNAGSAALAEKKEYEKALEDYNKTVAEYESYLSALEEYKADLEVYNDYLLRLEEYDAALGRREKYEQDYAAYLEALEEYNAYLAAVEAYNEAVKEYDRQLEAREEALEAYKIYQSYLADIETCKSYLTAIESAFITSAGGHRFYSTLVGPTVATVVENKQQLMDYFGASEEDIDNAGIYTENLIKLLNAYTANKSFEEKFKWYKEHFVQVRESFGNLYSCLYSLYQNKGVKMTLVQHEKDERYRQFVSHLYMISTGLDDTVVADKNWKIGSTYLYDILEEEYYLVDNNTSDPSKVEWPEAVDPVVIPEITVTVPDYPVPAVYEPLEPAFVPVPEPIVEIKAPVKPEECDQPGKAPLPPVFSKEVEALLDAAESGVLKERKKLGSDKTFVITSSVLKYLDSSDVERYPVVTFLDSDGNLIKNAKAIDGRVDQPVPPDPPVAPGYTYTFAGWVDHEGKAVDLSKIENDLTVYPSYTAKQITYKITWKIGSKKYTDTVAYGELPECSYDTSKASDKINDYLFAGWDKPISAAYEDAVYTAVYNEDPRRYTVTWKYGEESVSGLYRYGETPVCPFEISADYVFTGTTYSGFLGFDSEITPVDGDKTYAAIISSGYILPVTDVSGQGGLSLITDGRVYRAYAGEERISLGLTYLISASKASSREISLTLGEVEVFIPASSIEAIDLTNGIMATLVPSPCAGSVFSFALLFTNDSGERLPVKDVQVKFAYPDGDAGAFRAVASAFADISATDPPTTDPSVTDLTEYKLYTQNGFGIFVTDGAAVTYALLSVRDITLDAGENGKATVSDTSAVKGDRVNVRVFPDEGHELDTITVKDASGKEVEIKTDDGIFFIMPDTDVTVTVRFKPSVYTIRFFVDGELYHSATYNHGDAIAVPDTPTKEGNDKVAYTFSGWTPSVVPTALASVDYNATFNESQLANVDYRKSPYTTYWPVPLIVAAIAALLLLVGGIVLAVVLIKHRKRKKATGNN